MFGVVFQNDFLYADTIEENIRFGRDIPHEDIVWATKIAQAYDFNLSTFYILLEIRHQSILHKKCPHYHHIL